MTWIDSIDQLQYYSPPSANVACYCELLLAPNDLLLQAYIGTSFFMFSSITVTVQCLTPDGATLLGDVTASFEWVAVTAGTTANGTPVYVNLRARVFDEIMCANPCFILRVIIVKTTFGIAQTVFDKYTERFCIDSCCIPPSNIEIQVTDPSVATDYDIKDYNNTDYFAS